MVIGATDSNPLVSCQGIRLLEAAGIEIKTGVLEAECLHLNEVFFHYMETGLPFVTVKYAQTLDGRIATITGQSQWISSPASLRFAHQLRAEHDAILVGIGTILKDNPTLTVRRVRGRNPLRVIVDSHLKIPEQANVLQNLSKIPTLIATTKNSIDPRFQYLTGCGADLVEVSSNEHGRVDLMKLLRVLAARNISSVLIEGGGQLITCALKDNLVNRLVAVIAPKILGKGIDTVGDLNIRDLDSAKILSVRRVLKKGVDVIIDSRLLHSARSAPL